MAQSSEVCLRVLGISAAVVALCASAFSVSAQSLQITSPRDGTVINPGRTITVTVSSSGAAFSHIFVVGEDPIDGCEAVAGPGYQCSIQVPSEIDPGSY